MRPREEFEAYLKCGRLEHGFLRVRCEERRAEKLVAFSCLPELRRAANGGECGTCWRTGGLITKGLLRPDDESCDEVAALHTVSRWEAARQQFTVEDSAAQVLDVCGSRADNAEAVRVGDRSDTR